MDHAAANVIPDLVRMLNQIKEGSRTIQGMITALSTDWGLPLESVGEVTGLLEAATSVDPAVLLPEGDVPVTAHDAAHELSRYLDVGELTASPSLAANTLPDGYRFTVLLQEGNSEVAVALQRETHGSFVTLEEVSVPMHPSAIAEAKRNLVRTSGLMAVQDLLGTSHLY